MSKITKHIIVIAVSTLALTNIAFCTESQEPDFADFYQTLETGTDKQAAQVGQTIFERIERRYRADAGFGALKSKMVAADFLANQMVTQLKKATSRQMMSMAGELFDEKIKGKNRNKNRNSLSVAPAKNFYETSQQIFSKPVSIGNLEDEEKKFLAGFYNLKLRIMTSAIAKAGQALAIAEPSFKGTYDYVLVLPLLHASESRPVNIDVLPIWIRKSRQLGSLSDSCLLHYGFAYHAQSFARAAAKLEKKNFSEENFYKEASGKCKKQLPRVAVDCLKRATDLINEEKTDERIALQFEIVKTWLESDNFTLAAGEAKKISDSFSAHKRSSNAVWLYFYALSRANNSKTILANIDAAISDPRCSGFRAKLMYVKWWALRRQKGQVAQIAALEHQLIADYGDHEIIAPIMLSQATDLLARQDYVGAFALLGEIQEKFPSTTAASQAKKMTEKLKIMQGVK